jgi:hypothetical protein
MRLSRDGQVSSIVVDECHMSCGSVIEPQQLVPDGTGGLLIRAQRYLGGTNYEARLIRFDGDNQRTEHVIPFSTRIDLVGRAGTVYLQTKSGTNPEATTQALDVRTWTPLWTASPGWKLLAAGVDDGAAAEGASGELLRIDATGALAETLPPGLTDPVPDFGGWIGNRTGELAVVSSDFNDATVWNSTLVAVGVSLYEPRGFGNPPMQQAPGQLCEAYTWTPSWKFLLPGSQVSYGFEGNWASNAQPAIQAAFTDWTNANAITSLNTSFLGPQASPMLTLRQGPLPPNIAGGIPLSAMNLDANGVVQSAVVFWATDTNILSNADGFKVVALHEIGHLLGLDDTNGKGGSAVMNQMDGKNDKGKNLARTVTKCDREAAWLAQYRSFP